ncbi:MAG: DUF2887 domain-containing protein [Moorea sp. SIO2B7]|nr:DUF2887 domain-containing protein [Moorena sp. SIO2B7]
MLPRKIQQDLIEIIETIIIYKLPQKTRKEIEAMLGLSEFKQTKVYQEALGEGEEKNKLKSVANMICLGLTLETIAQFLDRTYAGKISRV